VNIHIYRNFSDIIFCFKWVYGNNLTPLCLKFLQILNQSDSHCSNLLVQERASVTLDVKEIFICSNEFDVLKNNRKWPSFRQNQCIIYWERMNCSKLIKYIFWFLKGFFLEKTKECRRISILLNGCLITCIVYMYVLYSLCYTVLLIVYILISILYQL